MRRPGNIILAALCVALAFTVVPTYAQERCDDICTSTESCDTQCWHCTMDYEDPTYCDQQHTVYETCGDFTTNCSTCTPNWVRISRVKIGGSPSEYCFYFCECRVVSYFIATYHDNNNCGQADYTTCETDAVDFFGGNPSDPDPEADCCNDSDINRTDYCGGSSC